MWEGICVLSHMDTYNWRTGSFREGWEQFLYKVRQKKITRITKCAACEIKTMCNMCPATGELEYGDRRSRWTISATWLIYGPMPWTFLFRHMGTARIAKGERPIASWSDQRKRLRLARCSSLRPLGVRADHYR